MGNGILLDRPVKATVNTILLPLESYLWLHAESHRQLNTRGETDLNEKSRDRLTRSFEHHSHNGYYRATDNSFAGCKGSPVRAWEEGRYVYWKVSDMAKMLDEQKLPYKIGEPTEVIYL